MEDRLLCCESDLDVLSVLKDVYNCHFENRKRKQSEIERASTTDSDRPLKTQLDEPNWALIMLRAHEISVS